MHIPRALVHRWCTHSPALPCYVLIHPDSDVEYSGFFALGACLSLLAGMCRYAWCKHALDSSIIPLDTIVAHSYGINTWDDYSRLLANEFNMETHL